MNQEARGDAPGFRRLLHDVAEFLRHLRSGAESSKQIPIFLVGISWGGKLAAALERRHPGLYQGLALLCPGFCPKVRPPFGQRLRIAAARLVNPRRLFPIPLIDPELFTATPKWQQFIQHDEVGLRQATARLLVESVRLDYYLLGVPRRIHVPVLLMLAGRDRIIDNLRTRCFMEKFAAQDKEIIEYSDASHTLEFEPDPSQFISDLLGWLDRHSQRPVR